MNICRDSLRNHEEENGSMHGFECKKRWFLTRIHLKWHRAMSDFPRGGSITQNYDGKVKAMLSTFN